MGGDHGQGTFRFPMKILYIMNNTKRHESIQPMGYILLKNISLIKDLGDSINLLNESMTFNNQHISLSNIYVTDNLVCLINLLGKEHSSHHSCTKYKSSSKHWKLSDHSMGDEWTIETLKVMSQSGRKKDECLGVKKEYYWNFLK